MINYLIHLLRLYVNERYNNERILNFNSLKSSFKSSSILKNRYEYKLNINWLKLQSEH